MKDGILGIHHITAITSDAQKNVDFYTGVLGLRLVKITVNYDDPASYHLYYGDELGRPGSVLTFFAWPGGPNGRRGTGQVTTTSFSVPEGSIEYWGKRLKARDIVHKSPISRFEEEAIVLYDPDGMELELVAQKENDRRPAWKAGPVPVEMAIHGFHGAAIAEQGSERTTRFLTDTLGFRRVSKQDGRIRYEIGAGGPGAIVDILDPPEMQRGQIAAGTVHHIAWRVPDDAQQKAWHTQIAGLGRTISPVMDRQYFHSIYFREPGGVLFEIATDLPGFTTDETPEQLGSGLKLPDWMEPERAQIERNLPPLRLPGQSEEVPS